MTIEQIMKLLYKCKFLFGNLCGNFSVRWYLKAIEGAKERMMRSVGHVARVAKAKTSASH